MTIIEHRNPTKWVHEYILDTLESVGFDFHSMWWEYQKDPEDPETYLSGCLIIQGKSVIDYDGVFELPEAVKICLAIHYKLEI